MYVGQSVCSATAMPPGDAFIPNPKPNHVWTPPTRQRPNGRGPTSICRAYGICGRLTIGPWQHVPPAGGIWVSLFLIFRPIFTVRGVPDWAARDRSPSTPGEMAGAGQEQG